MPAAQNAPFTRLAAVLALLLLLLSAAARAEMFPGHDSLFVNDYADVIAPADERRLVETLRRLKAETGIEMTVLTIRSRRDYDHQGALESFATGLFNDARHGTADRPPLRGRQAPGRILRAPTRETTGEREIEITCRNCGYETREREVIAVTRSRGRSGFGGGRSSGGGASGRW